MTTSIELENCYSTRIYLPPDAPPLIISQEELDAALEVIHAAFDCWPSTAESIR